MTDILNQLSITLGVFKVILVLTSALLAASQYYDNRHKRLIEEAQKKSKDTFFELDDCPEFVQKIDELREKIQKAKKMWEDVKNIQKEDKLINNEKLVMVLWSFFIIYSIVFTVMVISPQSYNYINYVFIFQGLGLVIISLLLTKNLWKMKKQYNEINKKNEYILEMKDIYEALKRVGKTIPPNATGSPR